jgi:FixJ family two-component response regulator
MSEKPFIAILDDDALVGKAIKTLVRSEGIDADAFVSASEFVDLLEALPLFRPQCVILDVYMRDLNGFQVQEYLRVKRPEIAVIFITGSKESGLREKALAAGAIAFFQKPFGDYLFVEALRSALGMKECCEP